MSTTQDIAAIAKQALEETNNATESDWPGILAGALESIVELCQFEQMDAAKASQSPKRDTQFAGFAKAELRRIFAATAKHTNGDILDIGSEEAQQAMLQVLAQAAYDLVEHAIGHTLEYLHECGVELSGGMGKRIAPSIPDMAELPEEKSE